MEFLKSMSTGDLRTINSVMCSRGSGAGWLGLELLSFPKGLSIIDITFSFLISLATPYFLLIIDLLILIVLISEAHILLVLIYLALYFFLPPGLSLYTFLYVHGSIALCKMYQCGKKYYLYNGLFSHILK